MNREHNEGMFSNPDEEGSVIPNSSGGHGGGGDLDREIMEIARRLVRADPKLSDADAINKATQQLNTQQKEQPKRGVIRNLRPAPPVDDDTDEVEESVRRPGRPFSRRKLFIGAATGCAALALGVYELWRMQPSPQGLSTPNLPTEKKTPPKIVLPGDAYTGGQVPIKLDTYSH